MPQPFVVGSFVVCAIASLVASDGRVGQSGIAAAQAGSSRESSAGDAAGFSLEYEKFTLENGLDVILQVDNSDPIVAFSTVVHAGSSREVPGRTGFAHFFEHMAFNDSENVPRGWNRSAIPEWGGSRNGGTSSDWTIYYEVVPKDAFDKILWIDSDRLGYMINTVTQEALEAEIQVVKNEKRQRVDNVAYGYTGEVVARALYPDGHPYSWPVIGSLPDLQAATLDDLKTFYDQYYGAANATLAIVGDIDLAETREKVTQWFGEIRRGPDVEARSPMPVVLEETQSLSFEDNFARLPQLRLTFPVVESNHPDEAPLWALARILGRRTSPLYARVVEQGQLAPSVNTALNTRELAGEFVIAVTANAGTDLDDVKAAIETALSDVARDGVSSTDVERVKAELETALYSSVSTVLGKANRMAQDNEFAGDPAFAEQVAAAINAVDVDDVMEAFRTYIAGKPAVITSFVPRGQLALSVAGARPATVWTEELTAESSDEEVVTRGEVGTYARTPTTHDRSEPPFGELPLVRMPPVWQAELPNDVSLLGITNSEVPLVSFEVSIRGGDTSDPADQPGLSTLLARLMNEGTATKTAAELEQAVGLLGSQITVSSGAEDVVLSGTSLARNFEATVALMQEVLFSPRFEQTDLERVRSALVTSITALEANPAAIASLTLSTLLYGPEHPLGATPLGTQDVVAAMTLDRVREQHDRLRRMPASIHVAGDISEERARSAFAGIAGFFSEPNETLPAHQISGRENEGRVFFVDVPGSAQSVLRVGRLTVPTSHPDAVRLGFVNERLGGGISGDLSQTLRIEKGYTYGAASGFPSGRETQPFLVQTSVRANATGDSLLIIRNMLQEYGPGFSDADVAMTRQKVIKANTLAFESLGSLLNTLRTISRYGRSTRYVEEEQEQLLAMELDEYQTLAADYLAEDRMIYLVVGDKATQFGPVSAFARGNVVELDIYGVPVSDE